MFTALATALTTFLATKQVAAAGKAIPYVVAATPAVVFVVSLVIAYFHADTLGRVLLALTVANEAIIAGGLALLGFAERPKS